MIDLTTYLREIIQRNGLVNSGRLLNSTTVNLSVSGNVLFINIRTVDYYKYLDMEYKLTDQFIALEKVNEAIQTMFVNNIEAFVEDNNKPLINDIKVNITR
jgi:hypothetical protein